MALVLNHGDAVGSEPIGDTTLGSAGSRSNGAGAGVKTTSKPTRVSRRSVVHRSPLGMSTGGRRKKTLGTLLRAKRLDLRMTQRELAAMLKVKPAHVAYLELDRRRPSLSLLDRIADVLDLDRETLLLLSHPEAKSFVAAHDGKTERTAKDEAWKKFCNNKALLARYNITKRELSILGQVSLLGRIDSPRSFLFILNSIRQAVEDDI